jgi:rhodanese-related sulfurtransferase
MAITFNQMVAAAMAEVPVVSPAEAHRRIQEDPRTLVIDPRDATDIPATGIIPEAMNIDRSRPIITACESGELGCLAGKLLKDMGFSNVSILEGGTQAWKDAGFPTR